MHEHCAELRCVTWISNGVLNRNGCTCPSHVTHRRPTPMQIGQPFDTIKVRLQVLGQGTALAAKLPPSEVYKDSMDCVRKMVRSEGPLSFYKGTVAPLVGNMVLLGIHFPTFSNVRKMLEGDDHYSNFSYTNTLISGAAAGAAGSLVSTPVELVRTKMQMQVGRGAGGKVTCAGLLHSYVAICF